jgi:hypothetical protein
MREDDGTGVARKRPGRREVPDGFAGTNMISEIVLAAYSEAELCLNALRYSCVPRVNLGAGVPIVEGIILNRRELGFAI